LRARLAGDRRLAPAAASICSLLMRGACRLTGRAGGSVPVILFEAGGSLAGKV
jgi:hypothetical protein